LKCKWTKGIIWFFCTCKKFFYPNQHTHSKFIS
jgi:hypothetical protein